MTQKSFGPQARFSSTDGHLDKDAMRFNMVKCPYQDKCAVYGCPEFVAGFCDADDIRYANMHPTLSWDRTTTLGHGGDVCYFGIHIEE